MAGHTRGEGGQSLLQLPEGSLSVNTQGCPPEALGRGALAGASC